MKNTKQIKKLAHKKPEPDLNFTIDEDDNLTEEIEQIKTEETTDEDSLSETQVVNKKRKIKDWFTKKRIIGLVVILLLLIIGGSYLGYNLVHKKPVVVPVAKSVVKKPVIKPATIYYSPLTGLVASEADSKLPITAVMVENSTDARPQSGLSQAGIVFEALTEGGITRFMALYQSNQAISVGPIRSARPYFIDWMLPFNAAYAHVGGSPAALTQITADSVRDINQFYYGSDFTRVSSRPAPHNVYTTLSTLASLESSKGWTTSNFTAFPRKVDAAAKTPTVTSIDFSISNSSMEVHYSYDAKNNSYLRSEGGASMIDAGNNTQIDPKVVIAITVPWSNGALDSSGAYYTDYQDIGSGDAYIFQDGGVTKGSWEKSTTNSQIQFVDSSGDPVKLNAGQTWITAVGSDSEVSY